MPPGVNVGTGYVDIRPDTAGFGRQLRTAMGRDIKTVGDESARTLRSSFGEAAKGAAAVFGAAFAAVKVTDFLGNAVKAASDLNETIAFSRTVFDASAAGMETWGKTAAQNLGLSQRAALEAAVTFGNMFVQLGFSTDQAAALSQNLVKLGVDFRSATNADITSVLEAQASAFRGEYDALQKFLPLLSAATVEQRAMELTGKRNAKELTASEKAMATYQLMLEGAGDAAGDFARTSDSLANQLQRTRAETENASAAIGTTLMPVMEQWSQIMRENVLPVLTDLFSTEGNATSWASAIQDAVSDMAGFLVGTLQQTLRFMANVFEKLPTNIGEGYAQSLRDAADAGDGLRDKLHVSKEEIQAANKAATDAQLAHAGLAGATNDAAKAAAGLLSPTKQTADAQREAAKAARDASDAERDYASAKRDYDDLLRRGAVDEEKVADARERLDEATRSLGSAQRGLARAQEDYNDAQNAFLALPTDTNADKLRDAEFGLADAQDSVADAAARQKDAEAALKQEQAGDPQYQEKLADARDKVADAQDRVADTAAKVAEKTPAATGALNGMTTAIKALNGEIETLMPNLIGMTPFLAPPTLSPAGAAAGFAGLPGAPTPTGGLLSGAPLSTPPSSGPVTNKTVTINQTFNEKIDPGLVGKAIAWVL